MSTVPTSAAPQNTNPLQGTKFLLTFGRIPTVQYFCQKSNLPGISMGNATQYTPFVDLAVPGDKLQFDSFDVTFIVDEELKAWIEIYNWIKGMTFPTSFEDYKNLRLQSQNSVNAKQPQYSDASLKIMSALNNTKLTVNFTDIFPVTLSSITFDTTLENTPIITADVTFRYKYFSFES